MASSSTTTSAPYISKRSRSPEPQPRRIVVNVKSRQDGKEYAYKIATNAPLKKLMTAYCQRRNLKVKAVTFVYLGKRIIRPRQTAAQLLMEDEDVIDAFWDQDSA